MRKPALIIGILLLLAGAAVDRAVALRNAKALVALAWKAGFSMTLAARVQADLARLGPAESLVAATRGGFPLTIEEMRWQLEMLRGRAA